MENKTFFEKKAFAVSPSKFVYLSYHIAAEAKRPVLTVLKLPKMFLIDCIVLIKESSTYNMQIKAV